MFVLNSDITIGEFRFSGVHDVRITRSMHSAVETAVIKIPSVAKVMIDGKSSADTVVTGNQFADGDPVVIKLGYDGLLQTEFKGFVKSRDMNMPLEVTCEGYSWLLARNTVNISVQNISISDLLQEALSGIDSEYAITVICNADMVLSNVQVNGNGLDVLKAIHKYTDGCLSCFFIDPDVLWCGPVYTSLAANADLFGNGAVQYRPGYNIIKENSLKLRSVTDDEVVVKYSKRSGRGSVLSATSDVYSAGRTYSKILNQLTDAGALQQLANEKAYRLNYGGYEGAVETFLQPFCAPGFMAYITDSLYPERNGNYLIESVSTHFGMSGARRTVEPGPAQGFAKQ